MSGSTIGGVVGGVIGLVWGGGNWQLGFMIGSAIGGALDPQHLQGPTLGDIPVQTAQEGAPRPIVYGSPQPFPGNIIMAGPKVFSIKEEEQDKGGPVIESEEVHQTYAIRICEGPAEVITVWRDGKVVYDRSGQFGMDADSAGFASKATFYTGDETQLPSPTLEALPSANGGGAGNVPAHRGTAYMVVEHDNLTPTGGRIPNYEFRMASSATVVAGSEATTWLAKTDATVPTRTTTSPDGLDWDAPVTEVVVGLYLVAGGGVLIGHSAKIHRSLDGGGTWDEMLVADTSGRGLYVLDKFWLPTPTGLLISRSGGFWSEVPISMFGSGSCFGGHSGLLVYGDNAGRVRCSIDKGRTFGPLINVFNGEAVTAIGTDGSLVVIGGSGGSLAWTNDEGTIWTLIASPFTPPGTFDNGINTIVEDGGIWVATSILEGAADSQIAYSNSGTGWQLATDTEGFACRDCAVVDGLFVAVGDAGRIVTSTDGDNWTSRANNFGGSHVQAVVPVQCGGIAIPDAPGYYYTVDGEVCGPSVGLATPDDVFLSDIELDIAARCGISASQFDVSADTAVVVDGYLIGRQMQGRAALQPLGTAYFRDYPEYDLQIHSVPRGQASVLTLTDDDFVDSGEDEETRRQMIELPRKLNLFFSDPAANYARVPVPAERESPNVPSTGVVGVELPLVFDRDVAAQKAEIMMKVMTEEAQGTLNRELPAYRYAQLVTSDCIQYDNKRWRLDKIETIEGRMKIEAKRDRISNYESSATANGLVDPTAPVSNTKGPTILRPMNLPRLKTADSQTGMYLAATGLLPAWPGAHIYLSVDGGLTEQLVTTISARATMGLLLDPIDEDDEPISVEMRDGRELDSITSAQLAARLNGFALTKRTGSESESEVGQFQTATETADGYELTDVSRGQLGSTANTFFVGDEFTLLDGAVVFLNIDAQHAGKELIFRAVTRGTAPENNETVTVRFLPQFTAPETVAYLLDETNDPLLDEAGGYFSEE